MANMSYCRYQNTVTDMNDCVAHLDDEISSDNKSEIRAKQKFIALCKEVASANPDEDEDESVNNQQIYCAMVDEVPSLSLTPHEIADPISSATVVKMWTELKHKYTELLYKPKNKPKSPKSI